LSIWLDWDEANIAHIAEHRVSMIEAEEVIERSPLHLGYEMRNREVRLRQAGETSAGRLPKMLLHEALINARG
jgi:hypothetical protein